MPNADFDTVFTAAISDQFRACCVGEATGESDALFIESEFVRALGQCSDSATGGVVSRIPSSKPIWTAGGALCWTCSTSCSHGMSFLQHGSPAALIQFSNTDRTNPDNYGSMSLASCAFKVFEHLIHGRTALHILPRLDGAQGGFRWGADALVCSLVDESETSAGDPHFFAPLLTSERRSTPLGLKPRSSAWLRLA